MDTVEAENSNSAMMILTTRWLSLLKFMLRPVPSRYLNLHSLPTTFEPTRREYLRIQISAIQFLIILETPVIYTSFSAISSSRLLKKLVKLWGGILNLQFKMGKCWKGTSDETKEIFYMIKDWRSVKLWTLEKMLKNLNSWKIKTTP